MNEIVIYVGKKMLEAAGLVTLLYVSAAVAGWWTKLYWKYRGPNITQVNQTGEVNVKLVK